MKKIMADNGYYEAAITYTLKPNPQRQPDGDHFHVVPGDTGAWWARSQFRAMPAFRRSRCAA